jgi:hypothetical protein
VAQSDAGNGVTLSPNPGGNPGATVTGFRIAPKPSVTVTVTGMPLGQYPTVDAKPKFTGEFFVRYPARALLAAEGDAGQLDAQQLPEHADQQRRRGERDQARPEQRHGDGQGRRLHRYPRRSTWWVNVPNADGAPAGIVSGFALANQNPNALPTDTFNWLYPYKNTLFPRGLTAPVSQTDLGALAGDVYVRYTLRHRKPDGTIDFSWSRVAPQTNPPRYSVPQHVWQYFDEVSSNQTAELVLQRATVSCPSKAGPLQGRRPQRQKLSILRLAPRLERRPQPVPLDGHGPGRYRAATPRTILSATPPPPPPSGPGGWATTTRPRRATGSGRTELPPSTRAGAPASPTTRTTRTAARSTPAPASGTTPLAPGVATYVCEEPAKPANCQEQTYNGKKYRICPTTTDWGSARNQCRAMGMDLIGINSDAENTFARGLINSLPQGPTGKWWMGYNDAAVEGAWGWVDGSPNVFSKWHPGQPSSSGDEDCGEFLTLAEGQGWNDAPCTFGRGFICEEAPLGVHHDAGLQGGGAARPLQLRADAGHRLLLGDQPRQHRQDLRRRHPSRRTS